MWSHIPVIASHIFRGTPNVRFRNVHRPYSLKLLSFPVPDSEVHPRGALPLKGVTGMYDSKDPLFTLPQPLHKLPFQHFLVPRDPLGYNQKPHNLSPIFHNFGKFSVPNPKNRSKSSLASLNLGQKLVLKAAFR